MVDWDFVSLVSTVGRKLLSRIGMRWVTSGVPTEIGIADQCLHPLVKNWDCKKWIESIEANGFAVDQFIFDKSMRGMCIPHHPLTRIRDPEVRSLLAGMIPKERYGALDLIFRPLMHIIACKPT